jgi:hypothetical protein
MHKSGTGVVVALALCSSIAVFAQDRGRGERFTKLDPGTVIAVRTREPIDSARADYRVYSGTVDQDVRSDNGRLAIPRGSNVELIVRSARDNDLILDLESVVIGDQRYAVQVDRTRIDSGSGDLIGDIVGSITGAEVRGRAVRLRPGTVLSFRLQRPLYVGVADLGVDRDGHHYHDWYRGPTN